MISCIAIDDEPIALDILQAHAAKVPFVSLQETFLSSVKALHFLQHTPVDFVLLDIHMPDLSGIELAKSIHSRVKIIFTTAYAEYALQGFELAVADYLLKPIGFTRFLQACTRVNEQLQRSAPEEKALFVKDGYDWVKISLENLLYVEAADNYLIFQEREKKTVVRMKLTEAEERLPAAAFVRVHKSFIVNVSGIERLEKHQVTLNGKLIPLSAPYRKKLFDLLLK